MQHLMISGNGGGVVTRSNRRSLPAAVKDEIWSGWRAGESLSEIGRGIGKIPAVVYNVLLSHGGIMPRVRRRSRRQLSLYEREEISRGLAVGVSLRFIARELRRAPSTISREVARHGGKINYRATAADEKAWNKARRPKPCLLATNPQLEQLVTEKLELDWSPEQISGWLEVSFPGDQTMRVSHETIYRSLFIQTRGVLKKELIKHLRSRRPMRRSKRASSGQPRGQIIGAVSIRERPTEVEDRAIPGHWEGDLLSGAKNTHLATLVERRSRYVMLVRLEGKDSYNVVSALSRQVQQLPAELRSSLTWDRGMELADHKRFTVATDVKVYFCDPQSPWQRGTNENTNRLLRQYFPRGTNLSRYAQQDLDTIALKMNQRPRKTLGFLTPAAILWESVATTS